MGFLPGPSSAQTPEPADSLPLQAASEALPDGPNQGAVRFDATLDVVTKYQSLGIIQQDEGLILQPSLTVTFDLYEGQGLIRSAAWYFGAWNSFHSDQSGLEAAAGPLNANKAWYESDLYTGVTLGLPAGLSLDLFYNAAIMPSGGWATIHEGYVQVNFDDEPWTSRINLPAFEPYVMLLFELDDQNTGATNDGYVELGVSPSWTLVESETWPLSLTVPARVGLSLYDYYGPDQTFGYVLVGLELGMPLACVPAEFGAWELTTGVHLLIADSALRAAAASIGQSQQLVEPIGVFGLSMSY